MDPRIEVSRRAAPADHLRTPAGSPRVFALPPRPTVHPPATGRQQNVSDVREDWLECRGDKQLAGVERRFGLHGYERTTLEKVGAEIGVTRERARQIQVDALATLRKAMESDGIGSEAVFD